MSDENNKLDVEGLNLVWVKMWNLIKSITGNVDTSKGTLQAQITKLEEKQGEVGNFSDDPEEFKMAGVADAGESDKAARADHVHPDNKVFLTQAEYDALPDTKLTDGIDYVITDAGDDVVEVVQKTWEEYQALSSAEKMNPHKWFIITDRGNELLDASVIGYDENTSVKEKIDEVSEHNNYSNEEQIIGTWIDGRPIYRKKIDIHKDLSANTWNDILILSDIDVIDAQLYRIGGSGNIVKVNPISITCPKDTKQFRVLLSAGHVDTIDYVIIEYAKY